MKIVLISKSNPGRNGQRRTDNGYAGIFPATTIEWVHVESPAQLPRFSGQEPPSSGEQLPDLYIDLDFTPDTTRIQQLSRLLPTPVLINAVVPTLKEIGQPFIRINGWPGFLERSIHEIVSPDDATSGLIRDVYSRLNKPYRLVPDIPGMISGRILAALINEAYHTLQEEVSTKEEIDIAMKLGTNYPMGPFEWSEQIGLGSVHALLTELSKTNIRYAPATRLKKCAEPD
jgi:3-hydroxybutyryl-CoA dehydrogenase